ncbi:cytosolic carboxypeptidase Nna1-like, partial [Frankliniella occidentalis]|uniref:Cytosolic carboxypeptidase Nna1-like n=1 Tax=Frankliniella occidentalis TaxID=133901 RepID=A0A9C6XCX2_FRAOC
TYLSSFLQNALKSNQVEINTDSRTLRPVAKLREPRDPLANLRDAAADGPPAGPRWPAECQVLEERVQHIEVPPAVPEQYYSPTGREVQPQPVGEEVGQVVFQYYPVSAVNYFSRSSVGGSRILTPPCPADLRADDLRFESRFESGNLAKAVRITETYYELHLRTDLYTHRHMQWFYFRVENMRRRAVYRFSIVNLSKAESLYTCGMRPLLYSERDAALNRAGWRRCGDNIAYFRNEEATPNEDQAPSYTLSFNVDFPHDNDTCYLAHCYPYTYSDLQDYLLKLQNHPVKSTFSKLRLLCRSLAGNNVYYLTITTPPPPPATTAPSSPNGGTCNNNNCTSNANNVNNNVNNNNANIPQGSPTRCAACAACTPAPPPPEEPKKKKAVVLTARVHPGETPSSWMMKGFMDFLTGNSNQAKELRDKFIFKLVPMLNPDGVIVGNNRCSLTGRDLNRQYRTVIRETYPPVWHTKLMIRRLMEECGVVMYCDLHAHSRKHNVFIYGCENKRGPDKQLQEQVFPLMLHKNAADKFSFENCKFRIQRSKEGTGRVVVWMMGVANSYTMEASFGGSTLGSRAATHFSAQDFENMGRAFCETLLDFCDQDPSKVTRPGG